MKQSEQFQQTILAHLEQRANEDALFAVSFAKASKNIKDCCIYIMNTVKKSGCNAFADDEIFSMAIHYYDEDVIDIGKPIKGSVVVNHLVELTEEDKVKAHNDAIKKIQEEAYNAIKKKSVRPLKTKKTKADTLQLSLF